VIGKALDAVVCMMRDAWDALVDVVAAFWGGIGGLLGGYSEVGEDGMAWSGLETVTITAGSGWITDGDICRHEDEVRLWRCVYCGSAQPDGRYQCQQCGGPRPEHGRHPEWSGVETRQGMPLPAGILILDGHIK